MNGDDAVKRLLAFQQGKPLPLGETIHFPLASGSDLLIVAFVKMGGESAPWGVAWAHETGAVHSVAVPEPRNRDAVAGMLLEFAPVLLAHLGHPSLVTHRDDDDPAFRQVWLPNATHVEMLHFLAYTYTFTRFGAAERAAALNVLGRTAGWLFRESQRPGQVSVIDAAEALRESFTFPTETIRQHHLGFLLAWLETQGDRDARMTAAAKAEREAIATNLDPSLERDALQPLLERYNDARSNKSERIERISAKKIEQALAAELERRVRAVRRAIKVLRSDSRRINLGVDRLISEARGEFEYQYARMERRILGEDSGPVYIVSPDTDRHPAAAAVGFFRHEESADLCSQALLHDDVELQAAAIAAGSAVRGTVISVTDEGSGRRTTPVWTVRSPDRTPLRVRVGSRLCVAGAQKRTVVVRSIEEDATGRTVVVEVTEIKLAGTDNCGRLIPAATDNSLRRRQVTLVPAYATGIAVLKRKKVWERGGPGAWLTHAAPPPRATQAVADETRDELVNGMLGDRS